MSRPLRIAYVGNFNGVPYSTENDVRKAFEYLGHEVIQLQENKITAGDIYNTILTPQAHIPPTKNVDLLLITGTWDDAIPLATWLDIVHDCALKGIPTATLHLDTFWGTSRGGRQWWLAPMFHTAYIFTADGDYLAEWKLLGKNHIWLPPAVRHDAVHIGKYREEYACDVAFVGSNGQGYHEDVWTYRKELVDFLRQACQRNGWSFRNPGGELDKSNAGKIERGDDMNDFYASAKVTVGDSLCLKKEQSKYWSDRVPEATGRGGFLIMPQIDELDKMYHYKLPMYDWGDFKGLEQMIKEYLADDKARDQITDATQEITAKGHTYAHRAQTILEKVGLV